MISYPNSAGLQKDSNELAQEEVHSLHGCNQDAAHQAQEHELVILDVRENTSRSSMPVNSVSTLGVHLPLESPEQQRSHTSPFCGVDAIGQHHGQTYYHQFIRSSHPAD